MGQSSYEKIYEALAATKQCKALVAAIPEKFAQVRVTGVEFTLKRPNEFGQPAEAIPHYKVVGPNGYVLNTQDGHVWLSVSILVNDEVLAPLVNEVFGVKGGVPTYFCNKEVVLGKKNRRDTDSFGDWLCRRVRSQFEQDILSAQKRVQEQVRQMAASEETAQLGREFLVRCAVDDIKKALGAYDHLGKEVLSEAIDEFLVHSITDS
jgi:hypothetical protein